MVNLIALLLLFMLLLYYSVIIILFCYYYIILLLLYYSVICIVLYCILYWRLKVGHSNVVSRGLSAPGFVIPVTIHLQF